jgi:hypothetical protein
LSAPAHRFLLALLFDADLRERFIADRAGVLAEHGLAGAESQPFLGLDAHGLELDAAGRRTYLMSALCRGYPLTAGALGALPEGPRRLAAFLASERLWGDRGQRAVAFGQHLQRLLELDPWGLSPAMKGLLGSLLALEAGLADRAARLRAAVERGEAVEMPRAWSNNEIKRRKLALPPFLLAVELPVPTALVRTALDQLGPEDAWHKIESGRLQASRLLSVARADAMPVTVLSRAVLRAGGAALTGAGGGASIIDVTHLTAELSGRKGALLALVDGSKLLSELPAEARPLLKQLLEAGLLTLGK